MSSALLWQKGTLGCNSATGSWVCTSAVSGWVIAVLVCCEVAGVCMSASAGSHRWKATATFSYVNNPSLGLSKVNALRGREGRMSETEVCHHPITISAFFHLTWKKLSRQMWGGKKKLFLVWIPSFMWKVTQTMQQRSTEKVKNLCA